MYIYCCRSCTRSNKGDIPYDQYVSTVSAKCQWDEVVASISWEVVCILELP